MDERGNPGSATIPAAEYVMRLLPGDEARAFEERMARDPDARRETRAWAERLSPLSAGGHVRPAPRVRRRLLARLFPGTARTGLWDRADLWRGIAVMSMAAAALALWSARPATVSLAELEAASADLHLVVLRRGSGDGLTLLSLGRGPGAGRAHELWALRDDRPPVSLGLLTPERRRRLDLPAAIGLSQGQLALAVSEEPEGGSPTGAPTGPVIAQAAFDPL